MLFMLNGAFRTLSELCRIRSDVSNGVVFPSSSYLVISSKVEHLPATLKSIFEMFSFCGNVFFEFALDRNTLINGFAFDSFFVKPKSSFLTPNESWLTICLFFGGDLISCFLLQKLSLDYFENCFENLLYDPCFSRLLG